MAEVVAHTLDHADSTREFLADQEALRDPAARREFWRQLSEDEFLIEMQQIALLVRTGDPTQLQPFDGWNTDAHALDVPDGADKEGLLRETWQSARRILADADRSDEDALLAAGITVAGGVAFVHPFADGNGRVSRPMSYMVARGYSDRDDVEAILSKGGRSEHGWGDTEWKIHLPVNVIYAHLQKGGLDLHSREGRADFVRLFLRAIESPVPDEPQYFDDRHFNPDYQLDTDAQELRSREAGMVAAVATAEGLLTLADELTILHKTHSEVYSRDMKRL